MIERHLRRAHGGDLEGPDLSRAVQAAFESYSRYWLESFTLPRETPASLAARFSHEGRELLDEALALGRGAILAIPHLGGWDYAGAWLATQGYPLTVVVERIEPPDLFEWFVAHRRALGMKVVPLGDGVAPATAATLRTGGLLALLCDRDIPGTGIEVEFFGERTTLPGGPATLALRTGAPLLPTASYFQPDGRHLGVVRPALSVERRGSLRDDVSRITQDLAYALEALIRRAPEQWHLMQPNWPSDFDVPRASSGAGRVPGVRGDGGAPS